MSLIYYFLIFDTAQCPLASVEAPATPEALLPAVQQENSAKEEDEFLLLEDDGV